MKLNNLVAKPQLLKCVLDDEEIIKEFGEPIEWWVWDRQPLTTFLKFASSDGSQTDQIVTLLAEMILDESGRPLLVDNATLPTNVLLKVMNKMTDILGK